MPESPEISPEMRLFDEYGQRLYLTTEERADFLDAANLEKPKERMFCHVLHYCGCRPSEALELTPERILINEPVKAVKFRSLKKRKFDKKGREKLPQYRTVPVQPSVLENIDLVFSIRSKLKIQLEASERLWSMSRPTAYRLVKRVMGRAGIVGKQATGKGLRHGFGVAMVTGKNPLPIHILAQIMGHTSTASTECYLQAVGEEKARLVADAWER